MTVEITDLSLPDLAPYVSLTSEKRKEGSVFIAESPKVIHRALEAGFRPLSLLCESRHIEGDAREIIEANPDIPVFTGPREILGSLTGYTLTRGVLCAMERPAHIPPESLLEGARRICVIYDVCDATNVGIIFRSAAALGFDGVILSPESCDPLNRRAIRVSMGSVFQIPWCFSDDVMSDLESHSFVTVSAALVDDSISLEKFSVNRDEKYAVILGSEGYGLPAEVISRSTHTVKIPMRRGVDSLNVGAAAAILLWHFNNSD